MQRIAAWRRVGITVAVVSGLVWALAGFNSLQLSSIMPDEAARAYRVAAVAWRTMLAGLAIVLASDLAHNVSRIVVRAMEATARDRR